jgi:hypothetical protein
VPIDFYSGGTVTLLNTNNTSNLTYTLSEEKPLYVGRFYNYDNIVIGYFNCECVNEAISE